MLKVPLPLVTAGADIILLSDGEYDSVEMFKVSGATNQLGVVARTACDTRVHSDGEWVSLDELCIQPGGLISLFDVLFTRQFYGPIHVIARWDKDYDNPLYLVTNMEDEITSTPPVRPSEPSPTGYWLPLTLLPTLASS